MAAFWGSGRDRLQRWPVLPGRRPGRGPQPGPSPASRRTRTFPTGSLRSPPRPSRPPSRSALHPRPAPDERDRSGHPRAVRRHRRVHRLRLRRVLDPPATRSSRAPGPALEAPLRVRTRGRPEAPAPVGRRQGERGPDRPELGGHPAGGVTMAAGTMRPSQLLRKLAAYPRQNELAAALREVGRIETQAHRVEVARADDVDPGPRESSGSVGGAVPATRKTVAVPPPDARARVTRPPAASTSESTARQSISCSSDSWNRRPAARTSAIDSGSCRSGREVGNRDGGGDHVGRVRSRDRR